jgi:effector-binding domain-containing protein
MRTWRRLDASIRRVAKNRPSLAPIRLLCGSNPLHSHALRKRIQEMRRLLVILAGLIAVAPARADSDVEHARYSVVATEGAIEIRDYAPQIVAETTVAGERGAAVSEGFRRLAGYIFGDNSPQQKIAMTAPVGQAPEKGDWKVRFTMPAEFSMANLPKPNNAEVRLVAAPAMRMAAIRFSGIVSDDALAENQEKLLDYVKRQGLSPKGAPQYAFYDPPWTLPWNRRNEVMVEIGR